MAQENKRRKLDHTSSSSDSNTGNDGNVAENDSMEIDEAKEPAGHDSNTKSSKLASYKAFGCADEVLNALRGNNTSMQVDGNFSPQQLTLPSTSTFPHCLQKAMDEIKWRGFVD
jgi:hypothetical protein